MPKPQQPRHGSMQVWPRVRAKSVRPRIRSWANIKEPKLIGFPGFKVGMTHMMLTESDSNSKSKGETIAVPSTIIECPPVKIMGAAFYKVKDTKDTKVKTILHTDFDKYLKRRIIAPKKKVSGMDDIKPEEFDDVKVLIQTQPSLTGIGTKKPQLFEMALGGKKEDKITFIKENMGKPVNISDVFGPGEVCDLHAVTKGKGFQGPVKRFGVMIRSHKSEKTKRGPGSLGGWCGQGGFMYRVAHAGQMGYHQRTQYNNRVLKVGQDPKEVNPAGGFLRYGNVKTDYIMIQGSTPGVSKRIIMMTKPIRPNKKSKQMDIQIDSIDLSSKQGR